MRAFRLTASGGWGIRSLSGTLIAVAVLAVAVLAAAVLTGAPAGAVAVPAGAVAVPAPAHSAAVAATAAAPRVHVRGADLVNAGTGAPLWRKDVNVRRPMGSITKLMTAILVLRSGDLRRKITVTQGAIRYVHRDGASSAGLRAGDVLTTRQLLKAMLIPSGCDAAYMLATSYGPGRRAFVRKMNAAAKAMGLASTHFSWFDGMPFPTEQSTYSTPADLIRLGERAMRMPLLRHIVALRRDRLAATAQHRTYVWRTTNELLGHYRGAVGIKTGNTNAAGNCLLFEARRGGRTLIGAVLHVNPSSDWNALFTAARRLLNWGFRGMGTATPQGLAMRRWR